MNEKEAIRVVQGYRRLDECMHNEARLPACDMAILALERQIPYKPENKTRHRGGFEKEHCTNCDTDYQVDRRYSITDEYCGKCGKLLDSGFRNYCANCGQKVEVHN